MCHVGWRNVWSMKWMVPGQEVDQRTLGERLWKNTVRHVNWTERIPWIVIDGGSRYGWLITTVDVSGWSILWYRLTRVGPDKIHRAVKCLCVLNNFLNVKKTTDLSDFCVHHLRIRRLFVKYERHLALVIYVCSILCIFYTYSAQFLSVVHCLYITRWTITVAAGSHL